MKARLTLKLWNHANVLPRILLNRVQGTSAPPWIYLWVFTGDRLFYYCSQFMTEHRRQVTRGVHSSGRGASCNGQHWLDNAISQNNPRTVLQPETLPIWYSFLFSPFTGVKPAFQSGGFPCLHLLLLPTLHMCCLWTWWYKTFRRIIKKERKERSIKIKGRSNWKWIKIDFFPYCLWEVIGLSTDFIWIFRIAFIVFPLEGSTYVAYITCQKNNNAEL